MVTLRNGTVTKLLLGVPILSKDVKPTLKGEWRMPEFRLLLTNYGELSPVEVERTQVWLMLLL